MKPTKCPAKEKLTRQQMRKKKAGEKAKEKNKDHCVTFSSLACERKRIPVVASFHPSLVTGRREATTGNTSAFAGYLNPIPNQDT